MKTKTINIYEINQKWLQWHIHNADTMEISADKTLVQAAIYHSPLWKWRGMVSPMGTIEVPDMDYYNALTNPAEMQSVLNELKL